jgi:hypothetical protein
MFSAFKSSGQSNFARQSILAIFLTVISFTTQAQYALTPFGQIIFIENGWFGEGFGINMENSVQTTGCPRPGNEYGIEASHQAYKILVALMITAYTQKLPVQLVVEPGTCVLGSRTKIMAIRLSD